MGVTANHYLSILSKDASNNTARVRYIVQIETSGTSYQGYTQTGKFHIDGVEYTENYTLPKNTTTTVFDKTVTIDEASGKTVVANFSCYTTPTFGTLTGSTSVYIDLPRFANCSQLANDITETSIDIIWRSDATIDYLWYSIDNGVSYTPVGSVNALTGSYTINGLEAGKSYNIITKVRRKDSQLISSSAVMYITTYQYPYVVSIDRTTLTIGDKFVVQVYNPLKHHLDLLMKQGSTNGRLLYTLSGFEYGTAGYSASPSSVNLYNSIPNSSSGKAVVYINYNNHIVNTKILNYQIKGTEIPTFEDYDYEDSNETTLSLTGDNKKIIKGHSSLKTIISVVKKAIAHNYATMDRYQLNVANRLPVSALYSDDNNVEMTINNIENSSITVYAIDSRGLSKSVTKTISSENFIDFTDIMIKNAIATRSEGGVGKGVNLTYSGSIWNNSFGLISNSIKSIKYYYRIVGNEEWIEGNTTLNPILSENTFSQTVEIQGDLAGEGFNQKNTYEIKIKVFDKLSSYTFQTILGSGKPLVAYHKDGISIGKKYDEELGGTLQIWGMAYKDGQELVTGGGGTTNYKNLTNKPSINGTTLVDNISSDALGLVDNDKLNDELSKKVDKVIGKGLSSNDFTNDDKQKLNNAIIEEKEVYIGDEANIPQEAKIFINPNEPQIQLIPEIYDSGWIDGTISSNFVLYDNTEDSKIKFRKVDKLVQIRGTVKPASNIVSSGSGVTIFTLPTGFIPPYPIRQICQGTSMNRWLLVVNTNGTVTFSRYGTTEYTTAATTHWLPFNCMFFVN